MFIATATSACASAGASLVPSPVIATSRPPAWILADQLELRFGRGLGEEVVDARFGGDRGGGERVVAGDHDRLDAHAAQLGEALLDAAFDDVLELDDAEHARAFGDDERRAALLGDRRRRSRCDLGGNAPPLRVDVRLDRVGRAFADLRGRRDRRRSCASAR